jgi:hypothetical protein
VSLADPSGSVPTTRHVDQRQSCIAGAFWRTIPAEEESEVQGRTRSVIISATFTWILVCRPWSIEASETVRSIFRRKSEEAVGDFPHRLSQLCNLSAEVIIRSSHLLARCSTWKTDGSFEERWELGHMVSLCTWYLDSRIFQIH